MLLGFSFNECHSIFYPIIQIGWAALTQGFLAYGRHLSICHESVLDYSPKLQSFSFGPRILLVLISEDDWKLECRNEN